MAEPQDLYNQILSPTPPNGTGSDSRDPASTCGATGRALDPCRQALPRLTSHIHIHIYMEVYGTTTRAFVDEYNGS